MVNRDHNVLLLSFIFSLIASLSFSNASSAGQSPRNVLLLTSYHQGTCLSDSMVQAVREALETHESVSLSIENLDMRRYTSQDHIRMPTEYLRGKYHSRADDLIPVSDDPSLNFLLSVREEIVLQ